MREIDTILQNVFFIDQISRNVTILLLVHQGISASINYAKESRQYLHWILYFFSFFYLRDIYGQPLSAEVICTGDCRKSSL